MGRATEESKLQFVERLLRSELSDYIVNCLMVAGFDTLDVSAGMNVGHQPIQEYISNFPGDVSLDISINAPLERLLRA